MTGLVALVAATQVAPAKAIFGLGGNAEEKYATETVRGGMIGVRTLVVVRYIVVALCINNGQHTYRSTPSCTTHYVVHTHVTHTGSSDY